MHLAVLRKAAVSMLVLPVNNAGYTSKLHSIIACASPEVQS